MNYIEELIEEIKLVGQVSSKNLAGYVITYRLLGLYKEKAIKYMSVLMYRRYLGDDFEFEKYIDNELNDVPKPNKIDFGMIKNIIRENI